ncbi:MAG: ABC transporter permease [Anaerolineaceae bacterium]|nr:ABC transporter permease [Anaerolineaceae bacterium]
MLKYKIERAPAPVWVRPLIPIIAILFTFLLTSLLVVLAKANPLLAFYNLLIVPLTSKVGVIEVLVTSTPLILTGTAVVFAFSSGYYNIGAEGQLYSGAIVAAWLGIVLKGVSPFVGIPLMILGGFAGGMAWALVPAWLKVKLAVDEVVTTLLLNSVMSFIVSYLLTGPWRDPVSGWPQSPDIAAGTVFFKLIPHNRLNFGFIVAILVVVIVWFVLSKTALGLRLRAVGLGQEAARFAGINVGRTIFVAALISGGIAGLAGAGEVAGIQYHLIATLSNNMGYTGIIIATLGALNPFGAGLAALFIGLIDNGAQTVSTALGVPSYLGDVVTAALLLVTLGMFVLQNFRLKRA